MNFKIGQLNVRKSEVVWVALERVAGELDLDVVLVQDPPHASVLESRSWGMYSLVLPGISPPKTAILIKNSLSFTPCNFGGARVCGITVPFRGQQLVLISAYIRHSTAEGADDLGRALNSAREMSPLVYAGLDGNGHSPQWGPENTRLDVVGEIVEGVLSEGGLWVVNS